MRTSAVGSSRSPGRPRAAPGPRGGRRPGAQALPCGLRRAGFTLLELLVVVAIVAIASAGVSFAMRDSSQTQLEREAQRLAALLESGRAQSRATGVPIVWHTTADGAFQFDGAAPQSLPEHWLAPGTQVRSASTVVAGQARLMLGPNPIIGPQDVVLDSAGHAQQSLRVATDGLRPFSVQPAGPPP